MKKLKMPSSYTSISGGEQASLCGGCVSELFHTAANVFYPEEKVAGVSRGYSPTVILVPEALFIDYAFLRVSKVFYNIAGLFGRFGL